MFAIATILIIRLQLWATNYPKLGGGKLHIAHLLWGGLGMLVAIVVLLAFLGRGRRHVAAMVGGIGFGFFIDEIGKFVTSDNDYFFKPAAGIIYIIFILLFLAIRDLWRHRWTTQECLANAMQLLADGTHRQLREHERTLVRELLGHCDPSEPMVPPLWAMLERIEQAPCPPPGRVARATTRLRDRYYRVIEDPRFAYGLVVVFIAVALGTLVQVALDAHAIYAGTQSVHVISVAGMASSVLVSVLILRGVAEVRTSRLDAYGWFDRALLVQIFLTEVFAFLEHQFAAVFELLFFIALLFALRTMIHAEHHLALINQDPLEALAEESPAVVGATVATDPA